MVDAGKLVKRIQEMREEGYLSDAIVRAVVKEIRSSDTRCDWVGAYLFNPDENMLWLHDYVGPSTEHARIPVGEGVCGTAVAEKKNQYVPDVTKVTNYLACNPRVKSEMVVLIRAGDEIFGQLDIDSNQLNAFNAEDQETVELVAEKLAEVFMAERR